MPSIHIINPACSVPGYYTSETMADETGGWTLIADLAIVTVAALVPDGWEVRLTDEGVSPVDLESRADFIALTGKVSQRRRIIELAAEFRRRGRTVLIGGSFASLSPEEMRPHADVLVTGELEDVAPKLFADLAAGRWADRYDGGQADIRSSPVPRWDLYPTGRAIAGSLQTTRGCPFNCEFCDVIAYQGRKQRHKTIAQVLTELDALHAHGFREVFLVDDNFTVHRRWARESLAALADWNAAHATDPMRFMTQASLDVARDDDLMEMCRAAGLHHLFMGVETNNEASLRETGKLQNLLLPVGDAVSRIVAKGLAITAGVIVGFDHDGPDIFDKLLDFFQRLPLPDLTVGALTAPAATGLYRRLAREGRLIGDVWQSPIATPFDTNIRPAQMSREALLAGAVRLGTELYRAENYQARMLNLIAQFGVNRPERRAARAGRRNQTFRTVQRIAARGRREAEMVADVLRCAVRKPAVLPAVMNSLLRYEQVRHVLDYAGAAA